VLGQTRFAATRINLAQSCNGIGWIFGPIAGSLFFYAKDSSGASTGSQTLWIPYFGVAIVVIILAIIFFFANVPDIKTEDDYHLDDNDSAGAPATETVPHASSHSIWSHPHFVIAVAAQFFYVAAQAGIFAFFINYMTKETPTVPDSIKSMLRPAWTEIGDHGVLHFSNAFASILSSVGFLFFLAGRFSGAALLKKVPAHKMLGTYALINVAICALIIGELGWISVAAVFLSYFFMSIMFPTIFALGIFGLGIRAKKASSFIVMAIMGGAILPKLMGFIADQHGMSAGYVVPMACFAFIAVYAFLWPRLSGVESMQSQVNVSGH
jgi:FHS family L-fucose permease-like MFS transporter